MRLTIELSKEQSAQLTAAAKSKGMANTQLVHEIVAEYLPGHPQAEIAAPQQETSVPAIDAKNTAAIAMLKRWMEEDATDDPAELRKADEEVEELKRNLNANRAATGERLVLP